MPSNFKQLTNSPWKVVNEIKMYLLRPLIFVYAKLNGVELGKGCKFYGLPRLLRHRGSIIKIGENFENRNFWYSNPLGLNHPTIICTWTKNAKISIGNNVGISGGSIVSASKIEIGDGTLVGANCTIIDTDFHPVKSKKRRYDTENIKSAPIKIGNNVFIGMECTILKGVTIPSNSIIPAGSIIRKKQENC